ncbi:hypothetical protein GCM10009544_20160 [Streptomyces stramineus]|uniref:CdiI immunity protein domain-containing protein n=2 Tax=Streptomyces TaxID=1883 RepID=A0ABP3JQ68_9ACTN
MLDLASTLPADTAPAGFTAKLERAAGEQSGPDFLRLVAQMIRVLGRHPLPDFQTLPMSPWEIKVKFPRLYHFSAWVSWGIYDSLAEGIQEGVESEHPDCHEFLPALAGELQEALILFPDSEQMKTALKPGIDWACADTFRDVLRRVNEHIAEQH